LLHPRPPQKQKAYHWRIITPANNQAIWPLQWWIIAPAVSCLARRIANTSNLEEQITAWLKHRNENHAKASWQFTNHQARIKLKNLYPVI